MKNEDLKEKSRQSRINSLVSIYHAESGHPGGVLSSIDILTYLYEVEMKYSRKTVPEKGDDRFILSKGHAAPALYAVAAEAGIIKSSDLNSLRKIGSRMQGHPDRNSAPWVEASTGSLGQGFSYAIGEAKGFRMQKMTNRVYTLLGDGELQEGEVWEGAMFAGHHALSNVCAIIDYNKMQSDDLNKNIITLEPLADKWNAFNWNQIEIDGHDYYQISSALTKAKDCKDKPTVIIAHTIKGKGVSYMEGIPAWHGSVQFNDDDIRRALIDLGATEEELKGVINE
jgi:transketolase